MNYLETTTFNFNRTRLSYNAVPTHKSSDRLNSTFNNFNISKSLRNMNLTSLFTRKGSTAKISLDIIQQKFKENRTALRSRTFFRSNKENEQVDKNPKPSKSKIGNENKMQYMTYDNHEMIYTNIDKAVNTKITATRKNYKLKKQLLPSISVITLPGEVTTSQSLTLVQPRTVQIHGQSRKNNLGKLRNFCDYYCPSNYIYCFIGRSTTLILSTYVLKPLLVYRTYEDHRATINIKVNRLSKFVTMNRFLRMLSNSSSKEQSFSVMISKSRDKPKPSNLQFESPQRNPVSISTIEGIVKTFKTIKRAKIHRQRYTSKWMKIIERLNDDLNIQKLNYVGYYDIRLGKLKLVEKYFVVSKDNENGHFAYFMDKVKNDLIVNEEIVIN